MFNKDFKGFNNIDEIIDYLENDYKKMEYTPGHKKIENGEEIIVLGGPVYDERVFRMVDFLVDNEYIFEKYNYRNNPEFFDEDWYIYDYDNLDICRVSYMILRVINAERICEGLIDEIVEKGIMLKLVKRAKYLKDNQKEN